MNLTTRSLSLAEPCRCWRRFAGFGCSYDKKADQRSWKAMQDFFNETFAK